MWKCISRGLRETFERNVRGGLQKERNVPVGDPGQQKTCFFRRAGAPLVQPPPALCYSGFRSTSKCGPGNQESKQKKRRSTSYQSYCDGWYGAFRCSGLFALGWVLAHPTVWRKLRHLNDRYSSNWGKPPNLVHLLGNSVLANPIVEDTIAVNERGSYGVQLCNDIADGSRSPLPLTSQQSSKDALSSSKLAFDEAAEEFKAVHDSILGEVENRQGVDLISTDSLEALRLFASATRRGYGPAAYNMAQCFELGVGTKQDFHEAALWYQRAVELGHPTAMYNLGVFYAHGWGGLKPSNMKARQLFVQAARKGQPDAISALGLTSAPEEPPSFSVEPEEPSSVEVSNFHPSDGYNLSPYTPQNETQAAHRITEQLYKLVSDLASSEANRARMAALNAADFLAELFSPGGKSGDRNQTCIAPEVPGCYVD